MTRASSAALIAGALALAPACAWKDGVPFGEVDIEVTARWTEDPARGVGWQKLASDFEVRVSDADATFGALALVDVGTAALNFDPANPPPGYSLCHNGHCHAEDGRLVPYEEIAAEIAGGEGPSPVLTLDVGDRDLVAGAAVPLTCSGGPCELPLAEIRRVQLPILRLQVAGLVRDTRTPPRVAGELAWTLALTRDEDDAPATAAVDLPVDRGHAPRIDLAVDVLPTAALLDGVRFELATSPSWVIESDPDSITAIHGELDELVLVVNVSREDY